ncbi:hypothetical protein BCV69DRAFT_283219 [Microstroma glucosiphilum]|uniref:PLAC8-domain-containing protein n=1 Tax=Pseudomicrostroma glucosiphilum TaxID=1684307 RepID=A0A316UBE7_9BASI|nr:hypothetical protein BCV69DRAFT_283219 [Pseudomicrostroma glucosiphilum]PWN20345.1 hypothetical protein BCV69DRAFT_283219 [Pseudomicrostroma glucosiphilum]
MCAEICEALCMGWIFSWWYNSTLGQNCCLCCDKCCRCRFLDDDGPLPEEETNRPRRAQGTTRAELEGDQGGESLPKYEENTGMKMAQPGAPQASMPLSADGQAEAGQGPATERTDATGH